MGDSVKGKKRKRRTVCDECGGSPEGRSCQSCEENIHLLASQDIGKDNGHYDSEEYITIHCPFCDEVEITKAREIPKYKCKRCKWDGPFVIEHDKWIGK